MLAVAAAPEEEVAAGLANLAGKALGSPPKRTTTHQQAH